MKTARTLTLACITALSIGASAAMAQEGGSTYPVTPDYWAPNSTEAGRVQAGSSDVETTNSGVTQAPMNWQDLPSYGGQG
jgi:hypothetical protein